MSRVHDFVILFVTNQHHSQQLQLFDEFCPAALVFHTS